MKIRTFSFLLSAAALVASLTVALPEAQAQGIGVNFTGDAHSLAPTDEPGIVPGANWNNVAGGLGANIALIDHSGAATTALLTFNSTGSFPGFSGTNTANPATNLMYQGGIFGSNISPEVTITLTNIPYTSYDVYVYASQDTTVQSLLSITDGTTTFFYLSDGNLNTAATDLLQTTSTNPADPTIGPGQYQVFSGLSSPTFSVTTGGSSTGVISNNVFGLQIVASAAAPEPGTLALVAGLLMAGGLIRRRK